VALTLIAAGLAAYYALLPLIRPPYVEACSKGANGPPDQCAQYDVVSAVVMRAVALADEHAGAVAAIAALAVIAFAAILLRSTERLWEQSRDTLIGASIGERAWVTFGASHQAFNVAAKDVRQLGVAAIWQNFGRTPARHVRLSIYFEHLGRTTPDGQPPETVIGPGGGARTATLLIPFADLYRRKEPFVVVSEITYNDIFSRTERRSLVALEVAYVGAFDPRSVDLHDERLASAFSISSKRHTAT
jgi:hypothetical protein